MSTDATSSAVEWDRLPLMLTPRHIAEICGITTKTVCVWHHIGNMPRPTIKSGNVVRWQKQKIRDWWDARDRMPR